MDTTSFWLHSEGRPTTYPSIDRDLSVDVVVIGGGMTGVTTAYLLTTAGLKVALVERGRCGHGETSRTTAHLTAVTDARLSELVERLGTDHGRAVWDAGFAALSEIQSIVEHEGIACGFEHTAGYLVGRLDASPDDHSQIEDLRREALCAADAGFEARFVDSVPGLKRPGIRYEYQAKFHPLKYLHALLDRSAERGCQIFEESQVEEVKTEPLTVVVGGHVISTGRVIVATHVPIVGGTNVVRAALLETDLYPYSSYVVRARIRKGRIPCGMFWDMASPYFYLRVDDGNNEDYAIFGGADHKTGQGDNPEERYGMVEGALHALVPEAAITERWSGQIIETRDGLPYIGETAPNQFAITGFSGNGITFGTVGAIMMRDAALGIRNPWTGLFDIQRTLVTRGLWDYVSENKDYPYYMIRDRFRKADGQSLDSLARGEGKLLDIDGRRVAAYRADDGRVTMLSPHCTHLGCVVTWNGAESTWDCPCHGSRFRATGDVMGGPAEAPLAPVAALAPVKH